MQHITRVTAPADMSDRRSLANFVEQTLEARVNDPKFSGVDVWKSIMAAVTVVVCRPIAAFMSQETSPAPSARAALRFTRLRTSDGR